MSNKVNIGTLFTVFIVLLLNINTSRSIPQEGLPIPQGGFLEEIAVTFEAQSKNKKKVENVCTVKIGMAETCLKDEYLLISICVGKSKDVARCCIDITREFPFMWGRFLLKNKGRHFPNPMNIIIKTSHKELTIVAEDALKIEYYKRALSVIRLKEKASKEYRAARKKMLGLQMQQATESLNFEAAIALRDEWIKL